MRRDSTVFTIAMLIQIAGVAVLLYGEEVGLDAAIYGGGIVALVGFGLLTWMIAMIEGPEEHGA